MGLVAVSVKPHDNIGVTKVQFLVDGVLMQTWSTAPYGYSWNTTSVANGMHALQAKAYDAAGNVGTSSISVTVANPAPAPAPSPTLPPSDTTPPVASIVAPSAGATVSATVTVTATASDNIGVTGLRLLVDGTLVQTAAATSLSYSWDTTAVANGGHTLQAEAFDAAGNVGTSSISVTVSNASLAPAPTLSPSTCAGVPVATTADLQSTINANPSGTTFCIAAGVHRLLQPVVLKSGDTLAGDSGAILDGSKNITAAFAASGSRWVATGQTQALTAATDTPCEAGSPLCHQADDVFFDNKPLTRVGSSAAVGPGTFYSDYANNQIWIGDNPAGHEVDVAVASRAIDGWGTGVTGATIENLIVQHFTDQGIQCRDTWTITHTEVRYVHGDGLQDCPTVTYSNLHDNGKDGYVYGGQIGTTTGPYLFDHNSVTGNNYAGYDPNTEAGGAKFMQMSHLTITNNYVANNDGPGLWTDWGNQFVTYSGNDVENNTGPGISHEASYDAVISNNTIVGNGTHGDSSTLDDAGIMMNDSQNVEIYGNTITGNHNGIGLTQTDRGSTVLGPLVTQNDYIHDNTITNSGRTGLVQWVGDGSYYTSRNNRFQANSYGLGCDSTPFVWQDPTNSASYAAISVSRWTADGEDVAGRFSVTC